MSNQNNNISVTELNNEIVAEETLNGQNAPSISDAISPNELEQVSNQAQEQINTELNNLEVQAQSEPKKEEKKKEISFGNLFKDFSLGATLEPTAEGNKIVNVKQSKLDYEQAYKQSIKNEKIIKE